MEQPLVIQTEHLHREAAEWLGRRVRLVRCPPEDPRFTALLGQADGLVIRTYTAVSEALLSGAPRLKVVGRAGVGVDNVDLAACAARGVRVVHTPRANTRAVVEYVLAMLLDELRPRVTLTNAIDGAAWKQLRAGLIADRQLAGTTLGICGFGAIGSQVGRIAAALDMEVVYNDLLEIPEPDRHGASPVTFEELLARSQVLSVHVDDRPANRHLFDQAAFRRCRHDVVFINTSRGFVVDAGALAEYLRVNPEARALLDVHEPEPFGPDYPLLAVDNARLSPHLAAATEPAHANMSWVVRDVWRVLQGVEPREPAV